MMKFEEYILVNGDYFKGKLIKKDGEWKFAPDLMSSSKLSRTQDVEDMDEIINETNDIYFKLKQLNGVATNEQADH